jgi:dihydrofolate reductase
MRKVIASIFISLDGFIVGDNDNISWVTENFNDEMGKYAGDLQGSMGEILLGRVTYQIMTHAWPSQTEETAPGAERMNNVPKIVFSRTLERVEWGKYNNARLMKNNIPEEIMKLKQQPGKDMVIYGSASIVQYFTELGLIDEYQLLVHPIFLGSGKPLFKGLAKPVKLHLLRTQTFKNGVNVQYYELARRVP